MAATSVSFTLSVWVAIAYATTGEQFSERIAWFPRIGVDYIVGIDGLSVFMLLLATSMTMLALWLSPKDIVRPRLYNGLLLVLSTGMYGVFCSLDLVLFYVFWETAFIPIYFLMSIWGEKGASKAALKFLVFMLAGSLVMLVAIVAVYLQSSPSTFDLAALSQSSFALPFQRAAFAAFFVAFAVKVPVFPFHVWLPDTYTLAPTPVTALMAACLAAMGAYGFWRIPMAVFPEGFQSFAWLIALLAVVSIVYGDLCATMQRDMKRMAAYASVAHMGFVMLGAAAANILGLRGSVLQTFAHGIAMAALFFVIDDVHRLTGSRRVDEVRRLMARAPLLAAAVWIAFLGSFGMPGLATFPGELTVIVGAFERYPVMGMVALAAMIITAGYIFWVLTKITLGVRVASDTPLTTDLAGRELASITILGAALIVFGLAPILVTGPIRSTVETLVARIGG